LKIETWQDRTTGANRSRPVIRVDRLELLGSKRDNETAADIMGNYSTDDF
jgi:single-strand DNA-binding protein